MPLLQIPELNRRQEFEPSTILRVEAQSNYCRVHFANESTLVVSKVLHWVQERLPAEMFLRVHRSHLVNKLYVQQVKGNQSKTLVLTNGEVIGVSRRKNGVVDSV